jgi:hypothetical protein
MMSPFKVSAEFAAFTWFVNTRAGNVSTEQALQFAQKNWASFLPCAHNGLGRLLVRLARPERKVEKKVIRNRVRSSRPRVTAATAG